MSSTQELVRLAEGCWRTCRDEIEGIDLATPVYRIPLWTVRDILMHCAFWNEECVKSLYAHADGGGYVTDPATASFDVSGDAMDEWAKAPLNGASKANVTDSSRVAFASERDALTQGGRGVARASGRTGELLLGRCPEWLHRGIALT